MTARINSLSKEYVVVQVSTNPGGAAINTAVATVEFAFITEGEPSSWTSGEWTTSGQNTYARILVGTGSTVGALANGTYTVWLRISQTPEVVVRPAGTLVVT